MLVSERVGLALGLSERALLGVFGSSGATISSFVAYETRSSTLADTIFVA